MDNATQAGGSGVTVVDSSNRGPELETCFGRVTHMFPKITESLEAADLAGMLLVSRECKTLIRAITPSRILVSDPGCIQNLQVPWKYIPMYRQLCTPSSRFASKDRPSILVVDLATFHPEGPLYTADRATAAEAKRAQVGLGNMVDSIKQMRPLEVLSLRGDKLQMEGLFQMVRSPEQLSIFKQVHTLHLEFCNQWWFKLDMLGSLLPDDLLSVKTLSVSSRWYQTISMQQIVKVCSSLKSLQLYSTDVADWEHLPALTHLHDLSQSSGSLDPGFEQNLAGLTQLQRLMYATNNFSLSPAMKHSLATLRGLQCLSLIDCRNDSTPNLHLPTTDDMPHLEVLNMPSTPCLHLQPRMGELAKLREIHVHDTAVLPQEVLNHLTSLTLEHRGRVHGQPMPRWSCPELRTFTGSTAHMGCTVNSPKLVSLTLTPHGGFGDTQLLFHSLDMLQEDGQVAWPDLTNLVIQHCNDPAKLTDIQDQDQDHTHFERLLQFLSLRERRLKHLALFVTPDIYDIINLIGGLTSLSSVTLAHTRLIVPQLRMLAFMPLMETVELINIKCVDKRGVDQVRKELAEEGLVVELVMRPVGVLKQQFWSRSMYWK